MRTLRIGAGLGLAVVMAASGARGAALDKLFTSIGLEDRCDQLIAFTSEHVAEYVRGWTVSGMSCGEGNGLGGARYNVDFTMSKDKVSHAMRLDMRDPDDGSGWEARLCARDTRPENCVGEADAKTPAGLKFEPTGVASVPAELAKWVKDPAGGTVKKIFGLDYNAFVGRLVGSVEQWPLESKKGGAEVTMTLKPSGGNVLKGRVKVSGKVPPVFAQCFKCGDASCVEKETRYEFKDRILMLTRTMMEKEGGQSFARVMGGGWMMDTPDPSPAEGGQRWSFVCGITRYSLQKVVIERAK